MQIKFFILAAVIILAACGLDSKETSKEKEILTIQISSEASLPKVSFRGICLSPSGHIYLSGSEGHVMVSKDKGVSWKRITIEESNEVDFRDIDCYNDSILILMTAGYPCKMLRSEDSGQNWKQVFQHSDSAAFLDGVSLSKSGSGFAFGDPIDGYFLVLKSTDFGQNWIRVDSQLLPQPLTPEAGFAASGSSIQLLENGKAIIGLGGEKARIISRTINDSVWKATDTPISSGNASRGIYSLAFRNDLSGVAVGGAWNDTSLENTAIYTLDGGGNWQLSGGKQAYRSSVVYIGANTYLACGPSGIDVSRDNGLNWEAVSKIPLQTLTADTLNRTVYGAGKNGLFFTISLRNKPNH